MLSTGSPAKHCHARWSRIDSAHLDVLVVQTFEPREWTFAWRGRLVLEPLSDGIEGADGHLGLGAVLVADAGSAPVEIRANAQAAFRVIFEDPPPARDVLRLRVELPRVCNAEGSSAEAVFRTATAVHSEAAPVSSRISPALAHARRYIEEHLEEKFDLDTLSAAVGMDRCHLCRSFRRAFGLPPHRYRAQLRLARARELITSGLDCCDAAYAVGFCDQSHLSRLFRESTGTTPGAYARAVTRRLSSAKAVRQTATCAA